MKPKPGDRVKIMDDTVSYTVIRQLPGDVMLVRTDDGLEIPVKTKELIISLVKPENLSLGGKNGKEKKSFTTRKKQSGQHERKRSKVVDLHISGSFSGVNGLTTIEVQLMRFRSELDTAIRNGYKEITFIHGVGSGVLKQELRKILLNNYPSISYHDASFSEYGYGGATQVVIKK
jgi:dsDNA-specific endonuclease/ATPase MutS2